VILLKIAYQGRVNGTFWRAVRIFVGIQLHDLFDFDAKLLYTVFSTPDGARWVNVPDNTSRGKIGLYGANSKIWRLT